MVSTSVESSKLEKTRILETSRHWRSLAMPEKNLDQLKLQIFGIQLLQFLFRIRRTDGKSGHFNTRLGATCYILRQIFVRPSERSYDLLRSESRSTGNN